MTQPDLPTRINKDIPFAPCDRLTLYIADDTTSGEDTDSPSPSRTLLIHPSIYDHTSALSSVFLGIAIAYLSISPDAAGTRCRTKSTDIRLSFMRGLVITTDSGFFHVGRQDETSAEDPVGLYIGLPQISPVVGAARMNFRR
jgi:hypothetical protein